MTDETEDEDTGPRTPTMLLKLLRKLGFIAMVLFALWVLYKPVMHPMPAHPPQPIAKTTPTQSPEIQAATPQDPASETATLRDRLDQLESWIKAHGDDNNSAAADKEQLAKLEERIAEQDKTLQSLEAKIAQIKSENAHQLSAQLSKMAAFGIVKEAVLRGTTFADSLNQLRASVADDAKASDIVEQLKPFAGNDALTIPALQIQFADLLPQALSADKEGNSLTKNLQSLIRIRKVGEQQKGGDDEAILARAEAKIGHGDMDAAQQELAGLSAPAAKTFAPWVENAQGRQHLLALLDALQMTLANGVEPAAAETPAPAAAPEKTAPPFGT